MKIEVFTVGKDNNFNLIRMLAAFAVLVSHSYPLVLGPNSSEPLGSLIGMSLGGVAVDVFFITSGFLVTASLDRRKSASEFLRARFLRIFPALFVMLLLSVFVLGLAFTTKNASSYLTDSYVYFYLLKCSTLITCVVYRLPGVFETNPFKSAVNGSLWTMPYEVKMYALLLLSWMVLSSKKIGGRSAFVLVVIAVGLISAFTLMYLHYRSAEKHLFVHLLFMFSSGCAFFLLRAKIVLHWGVLIALGTTLLVFGALGFKVFFAAYVVSLAYFLLCVAYLPTKGLLKNLSLGEG
jgi:peptidoglycan/LPS O-acetylase OafA/YrhL